MVDNGNARAASPGARAGPRDDVLRKIKLASFGDSPGESRLPRCAAALCGSSDNSEQRSRRKALQRAVQRAGSDLSQLDGVSEMNALRITYQEARQFPAS